MLKFIRSLFRHFKLADLGAILVANLFCIVPLGLALVGPLLLKSDLGAGFVLLLSGFLLAGQAIAVTGRRLAARFRKEKQTQSVLASWSRAWAEGLVVSGLFLGLFSLVFQSLPFYLSQGSAFAYFSVATLAVGTLLVMGFLPFFLPARREGLGLAEAFSSAFRLMNKRPLLALATAAAGAVALLASIGTFGLFPGAAGLAALHQGCWDHAQES